VGGGAFGGGEKKKGRLVKGVSRLRIARLLAENILGFSSAKEEIEQDEGFLRWWGRQKERLQKGKRVSEKYIRGSRNRN